MALPLRSLQRPHVRGIADPLFNSLRTWRLAIPQQPLTLRALAERMDALHEFCGLRGGDLTRLRESRRHQQPCSAASQPRYAARQPSFLLPAVDHAGSYARLGDFLSRRVWISMEQIVDRPYADFAEALRGNRAD